MSRLAKTAATLAAVAALAGCGGDSLTTNDVQGDNSSLGDYCATVKEAKASFNGLGADSVTAERIESMRSTLEELGSQAPDSVADDYQTLTDGFDQMDEVLGTVGLSLSDFGDQEKMAAAMADASPEQLKALQDASASLGGGQFEAASKAIGKELKTDCNVTFGG